MVWILPSLPPYAHVPSVNDLAGSGDYLYMIASGQEGQERLFVVDISDPLGDVSTYKARSVAVRSDHACIIGREGFQIIDISDPDSPSSDFSPAKSLYLANLPILNHRGFPGVVQGLLTMGLLSPGNTLNYFYPAIYPGPWRYYTYPGANAHAALAAPRRMKMLYFQMKRT
ncbi:MAG: hypothetical protein ACMUIL_07340 [bacterium]